MFEGLASLLNDFAGIAVSGVAKSAADAVDKVVHLGPDVVVMDTHLNDSGAPQAVQRLRTARPDVAVLVLSAEGGEDLMMQVASAGAAGYLSLEVSANELVGAIQKLADGELLVTMAVMARHSRDEAAATGSIEGNDELSNREREVLALMAAGLSNLQIGSRLGMEPGEVRMEVRALIEKSGVHSKTQALASAERAGLLRDGEVQKA